MPTVFQDDDETQQQPGQGGQAQVLSSPGAAMPAANSAPPAKKDAPTSSGSFTNLNKYLDANKGAAAAMGSALYGEAEKRTDQATKTGDAWKGTASKEVETGTVRDTTGLTGKYNTGAYAGTDLDEARRLWNAKYSGPQNAAQTGGWNKVQSEFGAAGKFADDLSDMGSRQDALKSIYGSGGKQYSAGESLLDSHIVGGSGEIARTQEKFGSPTQTARLSGLENWLGGQATAGKDATDRTKADFQSAVDSAVIGNRAVMDAAGQQAAEQSKKLSQSVEAFSRATPQTGYLAAQRASPQNPLLGLDPQVQDAIRLGLIDRAEVASTLNPTFDARDYASESDNINFSHLQQLLSGEGDTRYQADYGTADRTGPVRTASTAQTSELLNKLPAGQLNHLIGLRNSIDPSGKYTSQIESGMRSMLEDPSVDNVWLPGPVGILRRTPDGSIEFVGK